MFFPEMKGEALDLPVNLHSYSHERSQLRWLRHLYWMPPGRLPREVFLACPTRRRPRGRPRTCWSDYVTQLAWERLGILLEELEEVSRETEVRTSLLRQLFQHSEVSEHKEIHFARKLQSRHNVIVPEFQERDDNFSIKKPI